MTSEIKFHPESELFGCPFTHKCVLPKKEFCKFPECKLCTEYVSILKEFNPKHLF